MKNTCANSFNKKFAMSCNMAFSACETESCTNGREYVMNNMEDTAVAVSFVVAVAAVFNVIIIEIIDVIRLIGGNKGTAKKRNRIKAVA